MLKVGIGYDAHQLVAGRKLILGGVEVPHEFGLQGHSDADVLCHAVIDALLGAAGLGSIGEMFPNTEAEFKGASSIDLIRQVMSRLSYFHINNVDATIIAQEPKLVPFIPSMEENLRKVLNTPYVNIKATTTEFMGFEGRKEGMSAIATCILEQTSAANRSMLLSGAIRGKR